MLWLNESEKAFPESRSSVASQVTLILRSPLSPFQRATAVRTTHNPTALQDFAARPCTDLIAAGTVRHGGNNGESEWAALWLA